MTTPEADRSVYSVLFSATPTLSETSIRKARRFNTTADDFTLNLKQCESLFETSITTGQNKTEQLSQDSHRNFCHVLDTLGKRDNLDSGVLLTRYEELCAEVEDKLKSVRGPQRGQIDRDNQLVNFFSLEKFTWMLLKALIKATKVEDDMSMDAGRQLLAPSDAEEIDLLFDASVDLRRSQTIIDWLEKRFAQEKNLSNTAAFHAFKESGGMFDSTHQSLINGYSSSNLISELDPDAPLRQSRTIADQDQEDEQRLFRCVFELLRGGLYDKALKLAMDQGYFALAAGMEGWRPFRNNIRDEPGNLLPDEGNPYRDAWKNIVWAKISDNRVSDVEKAIYGCLCGHLEAMLAMCTTWEDHLWAHLRVFVDVAMELQLRNNRGTYLTPLPVDFPKENDSLQNILRLLESATNLEGGTFFRQLHKYLIQEDGEGLLMFMYEACREMDDLGSKGYQNSHELRLMANMSLFFKYNHQYHEQSSKVDYIVECYVHRLIDDGLSELVARCSWHLPDRMRESSYIRLLRSLGHLGPQERLHLIQDAQNNDIDIYRFLKLFVYETIHSDPISNDNVHNTDEVEESDMKKINALEWLFVEKDHYVTGLKYANCALRSLTLSQRHKSSRSLLAVVPEDCIHEIIQCSSIQGEGEVNVDRRAAVKEYYCFQEYLECHVTFNRWFQHYHQSKPQELPPMSSDSSTLKEMLAVEFKRKTYEREKEEWLSTLSALCEICWGHLMKLLHFTDGGFMIDPHSESDDDDMEVELHLDENRRRQQQMKAIRKLCIPQITSLLHTILHGTGKYKEAVDIANVIGGEHFRLYEVFTREDMAGLLKKLQQSSLQLLQMKPVDSLGFTNV